MSDSTLAFRINTNGLYDGLKSYIVVRDTSFGNKIKATFTEVWQPASAESGKIQAMSLLFTNTYYTDGSWPVEFKAGNRTYSGTLKVSDHQTNYQFIFPANSGLNVNGSSFNFVFWR